MIMQLKLPELTTLNEYIGADRRSRFVGGKVKKQQTELVAMECMAQGIKKLKIIKNFKIIWYHKNKRKDFDNVEFSVKFIKDGMVMAGIIPNDGWAHFPPKTIHEHEINKQSPGCVVIFD